MKKTGNGHVFTFTTNDLSGSVLDLLLMVASVYIGTQQLQDWRIVTQLLALPVQL